MTEYFATAPRGLEWLAAQELESLGARLVSPGFCGVSFAGDRSLLYRANLWARLPFRILVKLREFPCQDENDLDRGLGEVDWQSYLTPAQSLAVKVTGRTSRLNHSHFTALRVKNAIVDQQRQSWGQRSSIDTRQPDLLVNVHLSGDRCTVSLDSSGSSLHRRGYRPAVGAAPLKESLAAALIQLSGWTPDLAFCDPLCGSGTLPLEAGLKALKVAPGLFRSHFGFQGWLDFDGRLWEQLCQEARGSQLHQLQAPILGSDADPEAIRQARANAASCGVGRHLRLLAADLGQVEAPAETGIVLCNPPYGKRLGSPRELGELYGRLGDVLKQRFKGWTAFVLSGNKELAKTIGLKSSQRIPIDNGSLPCQLMKYELY